MNRYVIDASVAVKWVIQEEYQNESRLYLDEKNQLYAPSFLLLECASAIQNAVRRGEILPDEGWQAFEILRDYDQWYLLSPYPLLEKAYQLANQLWHSIYDCFYLALAEKENAVVVTADRKFYERVKASPYANRITWVTENMNES